MKAESTKGSPVILIHLFGLLLLSAALAINPYKIARSFFSDEAVYYLMAYSFAEDHDMEFQRADLIRAYKESSNGPQGIILKLDERDGTIVFGKSFLYSLSASPLVRLLKTNGFFALNALLLWLNLLCAYRFCSSIMEQRTALLFSFFYFVANASLLYLFWMTPEYFTMSLVCYGFFCFVADECLKSPPKILTSPYNYLLAAFFFALATYSKPPNALLVVPLGIWMLARKKVLPALLTLSIYVLVTVALFGTNMYFTGEWNYQGGQRALFYSHFPFERPGVSEFAPFKIKRPIEAMVRPPFYLQAFSYNWIYFFFGRFSGLAIYFFPMFFGLLYFLFSKKSSLSVAIYLAGWLGILTYMIGIPWNYFGGSGTIGNRYLMNAFPIFLFILQQEPSRKWIGAGMAASLLFSSAFLVTPSFSSSNVAFHQRQSILRELPLEETLLSDLPINNNPRGRRVFFDQPTNYFLYFIDDNTYYKETLESYGGFWVKGERTAEFVMRAFQPVSRLVMRIKSLQPNNIATISINGESEKILLKEPTFYERKIPLSRPLLYDRDNKGATYLYRIRIHSDSGLISNSTVTGERYLGCFVRLELPEIQKTEVPEPEPL